MANPKELLQLEEQRKARLKEIYDLQTKILALEKDKAKWTSEQIDDYKELRTTLGLTRKELSITATQIKKINSETTELSKSFSNIAGSIGSLSELQEDFKKELVKTSVKAFDLGKTIGEAGDSNKEKYQEAIKLSAELIDINARLGALTKEDDLEKLALQQEYAEKFDTIKEISTKLLIASKTQSEIEQKRAETLGSIADEIQKGHKEAETFANVDKEHSEFLKELSEDYHNIGKTLKKVTYTAETIFGSKRGLIGMALIGTGELVEKFHEMGREMGYSMGQANGFKSQMLIASILGEESAEAVKELGKELGDTGHISSAMAADVAMLAYNYKLSGEQAAYLSTVFGELQGKSWDTGQNTLKYAKSLAAANGVMPSQAMKDIASNSEFIAKYTKNGGKNIADAAVAAAKLGTNLGVAEKMADHLLDYQSSIDDEMEASVLLGKNINLNKARELAYNGDIAGAMEAGLKAVGDIDGWNEMDPYERQAVAKALGVQVSEMQQMIAHQENLNGKHGAAVQMYERSAELWHTITGSVAGKGLKFMGGMVLSGVQFASQLSLIKANMPGLYAPFARIGSTIAGWGTSLKNGMVSLLQWMGLMKKAEATKSLTNTSSSITQAAPGMRNAATKSARFTKAKQNITPQASPVTAPPAANPKASPKSFLDKVGNPGQLYAVAAALLAFGAAMWMLSKAFQNFGEVTNGGQALAMFGAAILGFVVILGVAALMASALSPILIPLAVVLLAFGAAVSLVGLGVKLMAEGFKVFSENVTPLLSVIPQIFALALAFTALAVSLMLIGTMGMRALPILAAVGFAAGAGSALFGKGGGGDKGGGSSDQLLQEIIGLRQDLNSGKIAINLDGVKLNAATARTASQTKVAGSK